MNNVKIFAVSNVAKRNFEKHFPCRIDGILAYGIPDELDSPVTNESTVKDKIVFALIGNVSKLKAQHIFTEAITNFADDALSRCEFWIIGSYDDNVYSQNIRQMQERIPQIKMLGLLNREEIKTAFADIDVVVCASLEDCLPIVVTEGMMHGKVCITTDATGHADYITDGVNGFIVPAGDAKALYDKMLYVFNNITALEHVRRNARSTYEKYFSMESFGDRLEKILLSATKEQEETMDIKTNSENIKMGGGRLLSNNCVGYDYSAVSRAA